MNKEIDIINYLDNAKLVLERILKDVYLYNDNLSEFILHCQKYDKNNDIIENIMIKKFDIISELFYKSVTNHLSIINDEYGFGGKIIKPVTKNEQVNIVKYCGVKKLYGEKYIQMISNVANIDNITFEKSIEGYILYIGKMTFFGNEKSNISLKNISDIINNKKNILENIEILLMTNIDFIKKYKNAFLSNIK